MQPLGHDMDELFRRAAEDYPLKTVAGDWENLSMQLVDESSAISSQRKTKYIKFWALLILLLISGLILFNTTFKHSDIAKSKNAVTVDPLITKSGKKGSIDKSKPAVQDENPGLIHDKEVSPKRYITITASRDDNIYFEKTAPASSNVSLNINYSSPYRIDIDENLFTKNFTPGSNHLPGWKNSDPFAISSEATKKTFNRKKQGFYMGLSAGVDFSEVKSQAFTKPGYNIGVLLGYRLNKNFSNE
jgi:hypothetical protein